MSDMITIAEYSRQGADNMGRGHASPMAAIKTGNPVIPQQKVMIFLDDPFAVFRLLIWRVQDVVGNTDRDGQLAGFDHG